MQRRNLKLAIVGAEMRHWRLAAEANKYLPKEQHFSEQHVTQIVTCRKNPTPEQAVALARVLGRSTVELFPQGSRQ